MQEFVMIPAITALVYAIIEALKFFIKSDRFKSLIPIICGVLGGALGLVVFYTIPGYLPADNWLVAFVIGIVSGCSATGANQIVKQLNKFDNSTADSGEAVADEETDEH